MNKKIISNKYFNALFNISIKNNTTEKYKIEIENVKNILEHNKTFSELLENNFLTLEERFKIVDDVFCHFSDNIKNLLKIFIKKRMVDNFVYATNYFIYLFNCQNLITNGCIFSKFPLQKKQINILEKILKNNLNLNCLNLENKIDNALIGGFKIIINNRIIYDYSIANEIFLLKQKLIS
ncbi:MAG: ATP synthase F1 subunit delta [Bacilli bacterium]|nr:ATP synthase F1 subunit delta [Bacilli bacterium]